MGGWVCQVCLVPNDEGDISCCCCTAPKPVADETGKQASTEVIHSNEKEALENDGVAETDGKSNVDTRVRVKYRLKDLKSVSVFVTGTSEIDQLPKSICDKEKSSDGSTLESLFECSYPTPIVEGFKGTVASVACGALHTALVTRSGDVYTFGCNDMGALGRSPKDANKSGMMDCNPCIVRLRQVITKVSCGDNHTLFLGSNGSVLFTGAFRDTSGEIGIPDFNDNDELTNAKYLKTPVHLPLMESNSRVIKDICSGENHCLLLPQGGRGVYAFGSNEFGQMMLPPEYKPKVFTKNEYKHNEKMEKLALTYPQFLSVADLHIDSHQPSNPGKRRKYGDQYINRIFTGCCTTFIETGIGRRIYGSGRNAQGELGCGGDDLFVTKVTEIRGLRGLNINNIVGGQFFTVAHTSGGNLYTWGNNCYTGHGSDDDYAKQTTPLKLEAFKSNVDKVFTGADATFVITNRGNIYAWGSAQNYILGNGKDYNFQKVPAKIPKEHFRGFNVVDGMGGAQHTAFLCRKAR